MQVFTHQLSNGIRLVHHYSASKVAYVSAIINTGTRDEQEGEEGIAHFIEHVLFKGTQRRKAFHILSRLDDVGGEIDAYTTKENTAITEVFLNQHYDRGLELLSDIMFNSVFPEKELEKEKEVVIDEINSYKDAPSELIFDDFEEMVFADHSLGKSILGSKKSIKTFNRKKIEQFIKRNYNTDEIIICSIGDIPFKKLTKMTEKYFGHIPENLRSFKRLPFNNYSANSIIIKKRTYQAHCILGAPNYDVFHKNRLGLLLLTNILAGPGMNSRLNLSLREKFGLVYSVEANYTPYVDTGLASIYFGTDKENLEKSLNLVYKELKKIQHTTMGTMQLHRAKKQMIGQLAVSADSNANLIYTLAKSFLLFNKIDSIDKIQKDIEAIDANNIIEIAREAYDTEKLSLLIYR